jgi:hypothetical protein
VFINTGNGSGELKPVVNGSHGSSFSSSSSCYWHRVANGKVGVGFVEIQQHSHVGSLYSLSVFPAEEPPNSI